MSICIGNTRLPDIPKDIIDNYPYYAIFQEPIDGFQENYGIFDLNHIGRSYVVGSTSEIFFVPLDVSSNGEDSFGFKKGSNAIIFNFYIDMENMSMPNDWEVIDTLTDLSEDYIVNTGANCIYSNYDILSASAVDTDGNIVVSDEVYFYKSIKVNNVYIQGLPDGLNLSSYPYAMIIRYNTNLDYMTTNQIYYIGSTNKFNLLSYAEEDSFVDTGILNLDENAETTIVKYVQSGSPQWVPSEADLIFSLIGSLFADMNYESEIIWSNFDIEYVSEIDPSKSRTIFLDCTVEYPDEVVVPSSLLKELVDTERILRGKANSRLSIEELSIPREESMYMGKKYMTEILAKPSDLTPGTGIYNTKLPSNICSFVGQLAITNSIGMYFDIINFDPYPFSLTITTPAVVFPNLEFIGSYAFYYSSPQAIFINKCIEISSDAFRGCADLFFIECKNLMTIGMAAFLGCVRLESISLPAIVTIGDNSFKKCASLLRVDIGEKIESIGKDAFKSCTALETVIIRNASAVVTLEDSNTTVFSGTPIESGTGYVYVPSALVNTYKTTEGWSTYANQFRAIEDYPDICNVTE